MKQLLYYLLVFLLSYSIKGQTYRAMTYNIRYDNVNDGENQWSKRKEFLSNQISFYQPDILGIQEGLHHQVVYLNNVLKNYSYIGVGRDDGKQKGEYSAIFYNNTKFKIVKEETFWLSKTPNIISVGWDASMERICTFGLFENLQTKQQFWVFNTHFDHIGNEARFKSAELILQKIQEFNIQKLPVLLMGDFNLKPTTKPIELISTVLNDTKKASILNPFGPVGTFNGFKFEKPVTDRIDYIFSSKNNIKVLKFAVLSDSNNCKYPSDHFPVFIEFETE
ncbi:endonuclease/exonuclease/phosphatase family protein [Lutibacter aestuarii]|uniref:Endonuclease/exonuclease/phosphatase family protein n=1 Tax=Lutibacter aestuarii TaxID=861111 RepID=A0ABW2Z5A9_9FLAO